MALITSSGFAHIRLTVTDIIRSKAFYSEVFGWPIAIDNSHRVEEPGVRESPEDMYGGTVFQVPSGALLGLRPVAPTDLRFDADHTGLDHISFLADSRDDLVASEAKLDAAGVPHCAVVDLAGLGIAILSFSDPDGIQLELSAAL